MGIKYLVWRMLQHRKPDYSTVNSVYTVSFCLGPGEVHACMCVFLHINVCVYLYVQVI